MHPYFVTLKRVLNFVKLLFGEIHCIVNEPSKHVLVVIISNSRTVVRLIFPMFNFHISQHFCSNVSHWNHFKTTKVKIGSDGKCAVLIS